MTPKKSSSTVDIVNIINDPVSSLTTMTMIIDFYKVLPKNKIDELIQRCEKVDLPVTNTAAIFLEWILVLKEIEEMSSD